MQIDFKPLTPTARCPARAKSTDAGYDLYSDVQCDILPFSMACVSTNVTLNIPPGYFGRILPRSGFTVNNKSDVGAGVVDSGYIGDIKVVLFNHGDQPIRITPGDRIAQIVFLRYTDVTFNIVAEHNQTQRGADGFGSSGQ